jgi:hypothetical protein
MNLLLVYPPFCTPAAPPYSITNIYAFLKAQGMEDVAVLDLNIKFHGRRFLRFREYFCRINETYDAGTYSKITSEFREESKEVYGTSNNAVVDGGLPELFGELFTEVILNKPDTVALSIVYSSQAFYALALIGELKKIGITTIIGGPAVNEKLRRAADYCFPDKVAFYEHLSGEKFTGNSECALDFAIYDMREYFVPDIVLPLKTSSTCYYKQCAYCSHYDAGKYCEYDLGRIKQTIELAINALGARHFFLVDEMIPKKRLLDLSYIFKEYHVSWTCQLRPTAELDFETLKILRASGLKMIMWGVESGNERVLAMIRKGTRVNDIEQVLMDAHNAGIKNVAYILFGFPSETSVEFLDTINMLKKNSKSIDLVSTSIFGLQKDTLIYRNPASFGVRNIKLTERTVLDPQITYDVESGLSAKEAKLLRKKYRRTIEDTDKFPRSMNFWREHMICIISKQ